VTPHTAFIDLEFDTGTSGGALLGDIASSLVSLDELLRDLGSIAAYPAGAEFRKIEIVAIEMRSPLKVKLALFSIAPEAVKAFQDICRGIIVFRSRQAPAASEPEQDDAAARLTSIRTALELCLPDGAHARITDQEAHRIDRHILNLQNAEAPLRRVELKESS
jgi:hypothetical protein